MKIDKDIPVSISGKYVGIIIFIVSFIFAGFLLNSTIFLFQKEETALFQALGFTLFFAIALFTFFASFVIVNPNEKVIFSFLGKYRGTTEEEGLMIKNPFFSTKKVSLKIQTIATEETKINDKEGIPLIVSLVVNYKVNDAAPFIYNSEVPTELISNTCEAVLREVVTQHVYDSDDSEIETLSKNYGEFSNKIQLILNEKLRLIGVEVTNANIANISYATEIAKSMLQRQQAKKIGESKKEIVKAAVGTVTEAIINLEKEANVSFESEEKKRFLKDLMLVIVSDQAATPTISISESSK